MAIVMDTQQQPAGQEAWEKEKEPAVKVRTPLISEILKKVNNAKAKPQKVKILQQHDSESLRTICKMSFDPMITSELPEGNPPFIENEAPDGTEHTKLSTEYKKLYRFCKGGDPNLQSMRREQLFVQLLEGLHKDEAQVVIQAKDKNLHRVYKGLSDAVVKEAFNWDDNYQRKNV